MSKILYNFHQIDKQTCLYQRKYGIIDKQVCIFVLIFHSHFPKKQKQNPKQNTIFYNTNYYFHCYKLFFVKNPF